MIIALPGLPDIQNPQVLWDNMITSANATFSSEASGFSGLNAIDGNTFDFWQPTGLTADIDVTLAAPSAVDCLCIAAHDLHTAGATVFFEAYDGSAWETLGQATPTTSKAIMIIVRVRELTRFRARVVATVAAPNIGVIYAGRRAIAGRGHPRGYTPLQWGADVELLRSRSRSNQILGNRVQKYGTATSLNLSYLERAQYERLQGFFDHYNSGGAFFYADGPVRFPDHVAFCEPDGGAAEVEMPSTHYVNVAMKVSGYVGS